jgi:hypothetical protein
MLADSKQFKVRKVVVSSVSVSVVNVRIGPELAAKMLLHDDTMLKQTLSASDELNITVLADASLDNSMVARLASSTAVTDAPTGTAWLDIELTSATPAGDSNRHSAHPSTV